MKFSDFQPEIDAIKAGGYEIVDEIVGDYGRTLGLLVKKDGEMRKIMLVECFYDTDERGEITEFHGVVDIRISPWSKAIRASLEARPL